MTTIKEAVKIAVELIETFYGKDEIDQIVLEEAELMKEPSGEFWLVTISFLKLRMKGKIVIHPRYFKRIKIDAATSEVVSITNRSKYEDL